MTQVELVKENLRLLRDPGWMSSEKQLSRAFAYYPRIEKVKDFVEEHLAEPIGLQDAARVASLEPTYFSKYFKEKTGVSFSRWLHGQRIERAIELVKSEEISIASLADKVGYSNTRTFLRAFRGKTGTSPSAYRKSLLSDKAIS